MFSKDKIKHFIISAVLLVTITFFKGLLIGIIATLLIGLLKEFIYDYTLKLGVADKNDMYANVLGLLFGVLVLNMIGAV